MLQAFYCFSSLAFDLLLYRASLEFAIETFCIIEGLRYDTSCLEVSDSIEIMEVDIRGSYNLSRTLYNFSILLGGSFRILPRRLIISGEILPSVIS